MEGWVACLLTAGREREPQTDSLALLRSLVKICGSKNVSFLFGFNNFFSFCVSWSRHCETPEPHSFAQAEKMQSCRAISELHHVATHIFSQSNWGALPTFISATLSSFRLFPEAAVKIKRSCFN